MMDTNFIPRDHESQMLAGAPWRRCIVIGGTFAAAPTVSGRVRSDRAWADRVANALRRQQPGLAYLNLCKQNSGCTQVRAGQLQRALEFSPDLAVVACGYDEIFRESIDPDLVEGELVRIIMALRRADCTVITMGFFDFMQGDVMPAAMREPMRNKLQLVCARISAISMRFGAINVDLTSYRASKSGPTYSDNGKQLSCRGHAIAAAETIRQLGKYLGNAVS